MTIDHGGRVRLTVNGEPAELTVRGSETLLETVRDQLDLTSVRYSCGIGVCGACTVLVDGEAMSSCLLLTAMLRGREVTTAEGLPAAGGALAEAQQAFADAGAYQCSYCIPAMALTAHAALRTDQTLSHEQLCEELAGNLCRCGSYPQVREALRTLLGARDERSTVR
ncbi:MAG: (2Fe-2S)-binding protein [Micromonosporaceae bacterium]